MEKKETKKSFEESLKELEIIVKELENGDVDLDEAIKKYTEAMKLAKSCGDRLNKATSQVNKILNDKGELKDFQLTD